jgi:peptidoglycan/xylan/chitin deacetylase (PgdA/CDA1 family)
MIKMNDFLILAYHSVSNKRTDNLAVHAQDFDKQLNWLKKNNYQSLSLNGLKNSGPLDKMVAITFDDGYRDNYHVALPILKKYGFKATIFITADFTGTDHIFWWDKKKIGKYGDKDDFKLLSWNQINEMRDYGIEFGSHTKKHRLLPEISETEARIEIEESKSKISDMINSDVYSFCYPAGGLNDSIINMVGDAGYQCGVITPPVRGIPRSIFTLRRVGVYYNTSFFKFKLKTKLYFQNIIEMTKRKKYLK